VPAVLTVTSISGSITVPGSLPFEVANSAPGDTIRFDPGLEGANITPAGTLDINHDLTIDAAGVPNIFVSGGQTHRVFLVESGVVASINALIITQGVAPAGAGGGILNQGFLSLSNSTVSGNSAQSGAGIENASGATMTMSGDTLNSNMATAGGGGIDNGGTMTVIDCTLAANVGFVGGGIFNNGALSVVNSTIAFNTVAGAGADGGGIDTGGLAARLALLNTIVFNPNSGAAVNNDVAGTIAQAQACLFGSTVRIASGGDLGGNRQGVFLTLGPLENNGGTTQTMALPAGSPAIATGATTSQIAGLSVPATDQRGDARPQNFVDIGAYQTQTWAVADFAGNGVQENTPGGFRVLSTFDAQAVAVDGGGDVVAAFAGAGLWRRTPDGTWTPIDGFTPQTFVLDASGNITAAFSGGGLWQWSAGIWTPIDGFTPSSLAVDGLGDVFAAFTGGGLWRHTPAGVWTAIDGFTPLSVAADGLGDVVASFAGGGLWFWRFNGGWTPIDGFTPLAISMDPGGEVFASFAGGNLWRWALLGGWQQIDGFTPQQFAAGADGEVLAAFADGTLWRWLFNTGWTELLQGVQTVALGVTPF
jgi:hypothetical protein